MLDIDTAPREALGIDRVRVTARALCANESYALITWEDNGEHEIGCIIEDTMAHSIDPNDKGVPCWSVSEIVFVTYRGEVTMTPKLAALLLDFWNGKPSLDHFKDYVGESDRYDEIRHCELPAEDFAVWADIERRVAA